MGRLKLSFGGGGGGVGGGGGEKCGAIVATCNSWAFAWRCTPLSFSIFLGGGGSFFFKINLGQPSF